MALAGTETVGEQMETPPSGDEKSEKVGNPFWSERAKEEAMVRSMRPSSLPDLNQVVEPGQSRTSTPTPLREALGGGLSGQDVGGLLQGAVEENDETLTRTGGAEGHQSSWGTWWSTRSWR